MTSTTALSAIQPFGAEGDPDLILKPTEAGTRELRRLFDEEGLLVFKGLEPLGMDQQMEVCRLFGPVLDNPWENMIVSNSRADGYLGAQQLLWHNDLPYLPKPYIGGSLHALEVDAGTTSTHFASGLRAWERLPGKLRDRVANLNALHVKQKVFDRRNRLTDLEPGDVCAVHAVVRQQRNTGCPYLFVSEDLTDCIIGLSPEESDALLAELFSWLYAEGETYEHRWDLGDIVIWDNETVQHARGEITESVRTLQRVSIAEWGYAQMYPTDLGIYSDQYDMTLAQGTGMADASAS
ncbi:MAG: TauD/TfdA family dioxygenase [Novosphingobium sp.]|nr:TauD/TfdA family dioxygenase [Novosphingobium sp.]